MNVCCIMTDLYPEGEKCALCSVKFPACCGKVNTPEEKATGVAPGASAANDMVR